MSLVRISAGLEVTRRQILGLQRLEQFAKSFKRSKIYYRRSGALKECPEVMQFGMLSVICTVVPGLLIGATISKGIANFLEENELFVPSDDDDDED